MTHIRRRILIKRTFVFFLELILINICDVDGGIFMIQFESEHCVIFESRLFKTTSTVIKTKDCIIVVDPTWLPDEVQEIRDYVDRVRGERPLYLLFTHSDWDHILGYGAFQDALVIASKNFVETTEKERIIEQIKCFDDEYYVDRNYPITYPNVDIVIEHEGQVLEIGEMILTFYQADGHTNDGIFTVIEPLGIWVAGDYLSDVEFPYIYDSSTRYEDTMKKVEGILQKHPINYLIPGHGHMTSSKEEILLRQKTSLRYIYELRENIKANRDSVYLIEEYRYLRGMKSFHEGNVKIISDELQKNT